MFSKFAENYNHWAIVPFGEGSGNPLQCSCLENPMDRGAWWASIYGVTQSRTQLKRLSSSITIGCKKFKETQQNHKDIQNAAYDNQVVKASDKGKI